jgi:hypothetical protein
LVDDLLWIAGPTPAGAAAAAAGFVRARFLVLAVGMLP